MEISRKPATVKGSAEAVTSSDNTQVIYPTASPPVTMVPDFLTNIWYFSTTPAEEDVL